ncbi:Amino acid transporter AVT1A-like protein [Drosera capensis]
MNPLARSIEELLPVRFANSLSCFIMLRTVLVMSTVCIAFLIPFFSKYCFSDMNSNIVKSQSTLMALIGSLLCVLLAVIMPVLCFLKLTKKKATNTQVTICVAIIVFGLICGVFGTYISASRIIKGY